MYQKVKAIFMRKISTWPKKYLPDDPYNIHNPFQDNYLKNSNYSCCQVHGSRFTVGSFFFIFLEVIDESTNCIKCLPNFFIKIFEFVGRYVFLTEIREKFMPKGGKSAILKFRI